ncbi:MAG: hypothetical protein PVI26_12410 [Chitinispirillia bacterium]
MESSNKKLPDFIKEFFNESATNTYDIEPIPETPSSIRRNVDKKGKKTYYVNDWILTQKHTGITIVVVLNGYLSSYYY